MINEYGQHEGSLRIWWNTERQTNNLPVHSLADAVRNIQYLSPEYNPSIECSGLEILQDGNYTEWHSEDGLDIHAYIQAEIQI